MVSHRNECLSLMATPGAYARLYVRSGDYAVFLADGRQEQVPGAVFDPLINRGLVYGEPGGACALTTIGRNRARRTSAKHVV